MQVVLQTIGQAARLLTNIKATCSASSVSRALLGKLCIEAPGLSETDVAGLLSAFFFSISEALSIGDTTAVVSMITGA